MVNPDLLDPGNWPWISVRLAFLRSPGNRLAAH